MPISAALRALLRAGITTLDTADVYGQSEAVIGQYLRLYPAHRSSTTISTKLTFAGADMAMAGRDMVQYVSGGCGWGGAEQEQERAAGLRIGGAGGTCCLLVCLPVT